MSKATYSQRRSTWAILLSLLAGMVDAFAGEWRIQPSLGLTERYSDNINAAPSGLEEDDFITSLFSGISLTGRGARLDLSANYSAEQSYSINNSGNNNLTHYLSGNATAEIIEQSFFVDANAYMSPTVVSNSGRITNQNFVDVGGNRADVISYTVTPRVVHHFGTWATANAQTSFGNNEATAQEFGNSRDQAFDQGGNLAGSGGTNSYSAGLQSGRRFSRFTWGVNYTERRFDADQTGQESTLRSTSFNGGYRINRKLRIFGNVGDDTNDFTGDENLENGLVWSVGAEYNPTPRTTLSGSYGDRTFGSTKNFRFSHRLRRASISGSYSEDLSTTAERVQQQQQQLFQNLDVFGNPLTTPLNPLDLTNVRFPITNLSLTNDVFISRNFSSSIGYQYRLNDYNISVFRGEQETVRTQEVEEAIGFNFNWSRPFGKRMNGNFNLGWQDRSGDAQLESTQALFITPSLSYQLGPHISTRLSYSYSENSSDLGTNDFKENSVIGTLSYAF